MDIIDFGISSYREEWKRQKEIQGSIINKKKAKEFVREEYVLIGEHFPVYTLGFHGDASNMLLNEEELSRRGCELVRIERGGDITYHGPGQLIMYPIIDLVKHSLGVKQYIGLLEETVISLLKEYGIKGERIEGATGVWIGKDTPEERKICAIGVKISRGVTMHGLALNVNTDLEAFSAINPCGFVNKGVASMQKELGESVDMTEVKSRIIRIFLGLVLSLEK
ncbi:MAG: lipoyl(octanoyl) transferase LipB [Muribaculaceae bacterium]|nr:lipoyl(octanoyl) transferase LipB [Muribaculaceae bacterium]